MVTEDIDELIQEAPTKEEARRLLQVVMDETSEHTKAWVMPYDELDYVFLERAFEMQGFLGFLECGLKKHDMDSIDKIGTIFLELKKHGASYLNSYPSGQNFPVKMFGKELNPPKAIIQFLEDLKGGKGGIYGQKYYNAIDSFFKDKKTRRGRMVWKIIWAYCWNGRYLKEKYDSSFKQMVRQKAEEWLRNERYDKEFIAKFPRFGLLRSNWESLMSHVLESVSKELKEIGEEMTPWILRDIKEFCLASKVLPKLDTNNINFLLKTGLILLTVKEKIRELDELKKEWRKKPKQIYTEIFELIGSGCDLSSINRNIYSFTSVVEAKHCRTKEDCERCKARQFCLSGKIDTPPAEVVRMFKEVGFK